MTFETNNRAAVLAARARDIVLDEARSAGRWEDSTPSADPALVAAVIAARTTHADDILAIQRAELARAQRVVDRWAYEGWGTAPQWARFTVERLKHLNENDDANGVDDALSAIAAALR